MAVAGFFGINELVMSTLLCAQQRILCSATRLALPALNIRDNSIVLLDYIHHTQTYHTTISNFSMLTVGTTQEMPLSL